MIIYTTLFTVKGEDPANNKYIEMFHIWFTFLYRNQAAYKNQVRVYIDRPTYDFLRNHHLTKHLHCFVGANITYFIIEQPSTKALGLLERFRAISNISENAIYVDLDCLISHNINTIFPPLNEDSLVCLKDDKQFYGGWFYFVPGPNLRNLTQKIYLEGISSTESLESIFYKTVQNVKNPQIYFTPTNFLAINKHEHSPHIYFYLLTGDSFSFMKNILLMEYSKTIPKHNLLPFTIYVNEHNKLINHFLSEIEEQIQGNLYVDCDANVLELGARYGTVSCCINKKLRKPQNHVAVEPDSRVWGALEKNKEINHCDFYIFKGVVSKKPMKLINENHGYGTSSVATDEETSISRKTVEELESELSLKFDTLVADCEGFLGQFFEENPNLYSQLHTVIFEKDFDGKIYEPICEQLQKNGFVCLQEGFRDVWKKPPRQVGCPPVT